MIAAVAVGAGAFVVMEPLTYAIHRWVMHGAGWAWHRSHHRRRVSRFETNDWYPVVFAALTVVLMAAGSLAHPLRWLIPLGAGVTAYGASYAFVHDLYIHGRFVHIPVLGPLERLRSAHSLHHSFGGEPYGMLCPLVPGDLRRRAATQADRLASSR